MSANEIETKARAMGWMPKEAWKGPETSWVDAEKYLERGEQIMPVLRANNQKLSDKLNATETEVQTLRQALTAANEAIEGLKDFRSTLTKERATEQKVSLTKALKEARTSGDAEAEVELEEKLDEVKSALKEAEKPAATKPATTPAPVINPVAQAWVDQNPWFQKDQRKTGYALGLANEWKAEGKTAGTKEFFEFVDEQMAENFPSENTSRRERPSKTSRTNNGSSESSGDGRTFADLPADAKAACDRVAQKVVGPNRAFKTAAEWRENYVKNYDWS